MNYLQDLMLALLFLVMAVAYFACIAMKFRRRGAAANTTVPVEMFLSMSFLIGVLVTMWELVCTFQSLIKI
ncbi:uncharacterized protein DMAD_01990 [Drosophila madeirensis]|uniref:Uncharacterized protein n=1 Tax=Drosophila madeirensis TaxID=30013 RepID=A0AAU9G4P7_DROMD